MAGTAPTYDNVRWGGPKGLRIPQEVFPATMAVVKQTDIDVGGSGTTNSITLDSSQSGSSYYTVTNAGSGATTLNFPVLHNGLVIAVWNNSGQAATFKVTGKTGISIANGKRAFLVMDRVLADLARMTADT